METKLKPCPFCGDIAELNYDVLANKWRIACSGCWAIMIDGMDEGEEALVDMWNTRTGEGYE